MRWVPLLLFVLAALGCIALFVATHEAMALLMCGAIVALGAYLRPWQGWT